VFSTFGDAGRKRVDCCGDGKWGSAQVFPLTQRGLRAPFIALVGLGKRDLSKQIVAEGMRRGMGKVIQEAHRHGLRRIAVALNGARELSWLARATVEGAQLANYRFAEYSHVKRTSHLRRRVLQRKSRAFTIQARNRFRQRRLHTPSS